MDLIIGSFCTLEGGLGLDEILHLEFNQYPLQNDHDSIYLCIFQTGHLGNAHELLHTLGRNGYLIIY